jgi:hypothetical protein
MNKVSSSVSALIARQCCPDAEQFEKRRWSVQNVKTEGILNVPSHCQAVAQYEPADADTRMNRNLQENDVAT